MSISKRKLMKRIESLEAEVAGLKRLLQKSEKAKNKKRKIRRFNAVCRAYELVNGLEPFEVGIDSDQGIHISQCLKLLSKKDRKKLKTLCADLRSSSLESYEVEHLCVDIYMVVFQL